MKALQKWLRPGLGVKRWLLLALGGVAVACFGAAVALGVQEGDLSWQLVSLLYRATRIYIGHRVVGIVIGAIGVAVVAGGVWQTVRSIAAVVAPKEKPLVDVLIERRQLERGVRIAVIGGGTGLSVLLRGLKAKTNNITAVVNVADDGGSSGRLREQGFAPPGDIRNCLIALSDVEPLMESLFQYRFDGMGDGLEGHAFGNIFIAALTKVNGGDFVDAIRATSKVLAIRGQVLPATRADVKLCARLRDGSVVCGQTKVNQCPAPIEEAYLDPARPPALPEAVAAIRRAEILVIGPGSLYSSIMPNLLVPEIAQAVRASKALKVYVCNVMTQPNEALHYTASDHVRMIRKHVGAGLVDFVLVNAKKPSPAALERYRQTGADFVEPDLDKLIELGVRPLTGDFINENIVVVRHDSKKLADAIFELAEKHRR